MSKPTEFKYLDKLREDRTNNFIKSFPGYHLVEIKKGVLGELSKVEEEHLEFLDALNQKSPIMALVELSDTLGAIKALIQSKNPNLNMQSVIERVISDTKDSPKVGFETILANYDSWYKCLNILDIGKLTAIWLMNTQFYCKLYNLNLSDLMVMSTITKRAFENGYRT